MCKPFHDIVEKKREGDLAAHQLSVFLSRRTANFARINPFELKRLIHEHWTELARLAHAIHDAPREIGDAPPDYFASIAISLLPEDMVDYAVSG